MQINKKDYPILVLRDIQQLLLDYSKFAFQYAEHVIASPNENSLYQFKDRDTSSKFIFTVTNPTQTKDYKTCFNLSYTPYTQKVIRPFSAIVEFKDMNTHLEKWISLLQEYSNIVLTEEEYRFQYYQKEYENEFLIIEEDADIAPFDEAKQLAIYTLLDVLQNKLLEYDPEAMDPEIQSIIKETNALKSHLQNLSKNQVARNLSKIYAMIRKHGIPFLKSVYDIAKKEIIKRVLNEGFDLLSLLPHHP